MEIIKNEDIKTNQPKQENTSYTDDGLTTSMQIKYEDNESSSNQSAKDMPEGTPKIKLKNIIEALLFSENNPLTLARLNELTNSTLEDIAKAIEELNQDYESTERSFRIEKVANGYQLYTLPAYSQWVRLLYKSSYHRLSRPSLEIVAIIVYNQPITRHEIEKLRGVDCSGPLLTLLERKLIRIEGRAKKPGGPFLYGTGKEFLRYFGLASLNDLPSKEELSAFLQRRSE